MSEETDITAELLDGESLLSEISRHVYLVVLNINWAKLSYQISDAVVEVGTGDDKKEIDKKYRNNPHWALMPDSLRTQFVNLEGKARRALSQPAIGFATKGMAMLPVARASDVFQQLRDFRAELEQLRDAFCAGYDNLLENLQDELGTSLYVQAAKKLPKSGELREKFKMVWAIIPIGGSGDSIHITLDAAEHALAMLRTCSDYVDHHESEGELGALMNPYITPSGTSRNEAIATLRDLVQQIRTPLSRIDDETATDLVREAREQMNQFTHQMIEDMAQEPREEIRKACENMLMSIRQGRTVKQGTIAQCRRAFELMQGFDFLSDAELTNRMRLCDDELRAVTPTDVNQNAETGARLANVLSRVIDQANNKPAVRAATRQFRAIRMRPQVTPEPAAV